MKKILHFLLLSAFSLNLFSQVASDSLQKQLRYELMYENYEKVIALCQNATQPELQVAKAQALFALYRYDETETLLDSILIENPNNIAAIMLYAKSANANGNKIETLKWYQRALIADSLNSTALNALAANAITNKYYNNAIPFYQTLYSQNPQNSFYPTRLGICYSAMNDNRVAIGYLLEALTINSENINALVSIINAYYGEEMPDSSRYYINYGLNFAPENPELLRRNAVWLYAQKMYNESVQYFEKTINAGDSSLFVYKFAGMASLRSDSFDHFKKANDFFAKAYALDSDDVQICYSRGIAASNCSDYNLAIQMFSRATFLITPDKSIQYSINLAEAENFSRFQKNEQALEAYKNCLKYRESKATVYNIATLYDKLNNKKDALHWYGLYKEKIKADTIDSENRDENNYIDSRIIKLKEEIQIDKP